MGGMVGPRLSLRLFANHGLAVPRVYRAWYLGPRVSSSNAQCRRRIASSAYRQQSHSSRETDQQAAPYLANEPLSFPCLDVIETRTKDLQERSLKGPKRRAETTVREADAPSRSPSELTGPEPLYTTGAHKKFHSPEPILLDWGGVLPSFEIAYETWGEVNGDASNAILLHTGLSASSHAASTPDNPLPGWWEQYIGPGRALDTDKYHIICTNVLGGCYGSTGPSSVNALAAQQDKDRSGHTDVRYATSFPIMTMQDMVRAQFRLIDHLGIKKLYASVGGSMGGMQSLTAAVLEPDRVGKLVSISGCARSHPYSIAMRHTQRQVLMNDPAWSSNRGNYYHALPPHMGMKLAREIATITYRSRPEWDQRFGRRRADPSKPPALCPDFLIETYLDHAGEKWCLDFDANSLLYISKAMDLFDLGADHMTMLTKNRIANAYKLESHNRSTGQNDGMCSLALPDKPYEERPSNIRLDDQVAVSEDLVAGLTPTKKIPALVIGVVSDMLFPASQQREVADTMKATGNGNVKYIELGEDHSLFGHDTFLLDPQGMGVEMRRFLN